MKRNITGFWAFILVVPIMFAVFPVPLGVPILLWCLIGIHVENWPLPVFYTTWLIISVIIIWKTEKNGYWVG